jgi:hypothetical protein
MIFDGVDSVGIYSHASNRHQLMICTVVFSIQCSDIIFQPIKIIVIAIDVAPTQNKSKCIKLNGLLSSCIPSD